MDKTASLQQANCAKMSPLFAHTGKHGETLAANNVSARMFPRQKMTIKW